MCDVKCRKKTTKNKPQKRKKNVKYNTYEDRKVSRVAMCDVKCRIKTTKNKPQKEKKTMLIDEKKWTGMDPI